jgi:DNA repair exonuclease SbcCD nuclease subunit
MKILFFSDTHLGFDIPIRPRIQRRRRGHDFFSNYYHILDIARTENVDLIVHGGDMFFKSKVPLIVEKAFEPLVEVANSGIPVYLVPGNHERSKFPGHLWLAHSNIHVFDKPKTFLQKVGDSIVALSGFPFTRNIKQHFQTILKQTNYLEKKADTHFLCIHQTFEGAKVGPSDFTFRIDPDNIPGSEIPDGFTAIISGHIHRAQRLTHTLDHRPFTTPVIYSGSIERTSFAERFEEKYYVIIKIDPSLWNPMPIVEFHQLPTRPMVKIEIPTQNKHIDALKNLIQENLSVLDPDSIVRIHLVGPNAEESQRMLSIGDLRALASPSMNISLGYQWMDADKSPRGKKEFSQTSAF